MSRRRDSLKKNAYVAIKSDTPTQYVAVGDKWRLYRGLEKGLVYKLSEDGKTITKLTRKHKTLASGEWVATYKPEPNKSTKPNYFSCKEEDFEEGNVVYIKLEEREEITTEEFMEIEMLHAYTRRQAMEDGVLVDATEMAKEAGIKYPVALSEAVYAKIKDKPATEDIQGRMWDVVWMLRCAITGAIPSKKVDESLIFYKLILNDDDVDDGGTFKPKEITLKALVHGGDAGEPVITVMLPEEY